MVTAEKHYCQTCGALVCPLEENCKVGQAHMCVVCEAQSRTPEHTFWVVHEEDAGEGHAYGVITNSFDAHCAECAEKERAERFPNGRLAMMYSADWTGECSALVQERRDQNWHPCPEKCQWGYVRNDESPPL